MEQGSAVYAVYAVVHMLKFVLKPIIKLPTAKALHNEHGEGVGHNLQSTVDHVVHVEVSSELGRVEGESVVRHRVHKPVGGFISVTIPITSSIFHTSCHR